MAVIEMVKGPAVVSPPISGQENRLATANKPLEKLSSHCVSTAGRAIAKVNPRGLAPIAARSERFTARALRPKCSESVPTKKCRPSTSISLVIAISSPGKGFIRAQSSPIPKLRVEFEALPVLKKRSMRSNSPIGPESECMPHFMALGGAMRERNRINGLQVFK